MNAVELRNVTKTFGDFTAVDDLTLEVPAGSIYGFIGPNGSGKTTTLRMIINILAPDQRHAAGVRGGAAGGLFGSHRLSAGGARALQEDEGAGRAALLRPAEDPRSTCADIDAWLARFDLTEWANRPVEALSKGMSQKVQFIAAVVSRPELLILDEPFSGLDPVTADELKEAVLELREQGTTVILSTHDMNVAERMCDFIFMIYRGRKVLDGTLAAIQDQYGSSTLRVALDTGTMGAALPRLPGVTQVVDQGPGTNCSDAGVRQPASADRAGRPRPSAALRAGAPLPPRHLRAHCAPRGGGGEACVG